MRFRTLSAVFLLALSTSLCLAANPVSDKPTTGYSWLKMTDAERLDYVMTSLSVLSSRGVEYKGSPKGYTDAIGEMLDKDSRLYEANVTNILASVIYEMEPENREALDKLKK